MKVSRVKHADRQSLLWAWVGDRDFTSMAQTRNAVGEWCEVAGAALFKAERHATSGTAEVCPDLSLSSPLRYIECKSIGLTRQGLVYAQRLERDRQLVRETGAQLWYAFFLHTVAAAKCQTLHQLRAMMADGLREVLVVSFPMLEAICRDNPARVMNYRRATRTKAARDMPGHRLPMKALRWAACGAYSQQVMAWAGDVYGAQLSVPITGYNLHQLGLG